MERFMWIADRSSVIVEKDAEIEESIIMASCTISEKAYIKHAS